MNIRSIQFRLIVWYASLFLLMVSAFGIYSYQRLSHYLTLSLAQTLEHRANRIGATLLANISKTGEAYVRDEIKTLYAPELNDRFMRVTRMDGRVIYVSDEPNDKSFNPKEIAPANLHDRKAMTNEDLLSDGSRLLIASLPLTVKGQGYMVEVGAAEQSLDRVLKSYVKTLLIGLAVVGLVTLIGGYVLIEQALDPVRKIISAVREITPKDLSKRLPVVESGDVIEALSKRLNQMIARLEESFQTSSRFTSDASHELRTPLTIIRGELDALLLDNQLPDSVRATVESLQEEAERLGKIVEGLLALSRLDAGAGQMECLRFDLAELVATTSEQMCLLAEEKNISVNLQTNQPVFVEGDKSRLKQVVVNLLDNAIKYTPPSGKIDVSVSLQHGRVFFEVADSGPGIRIEALAHVFDRFYRAMDIRGEAIEGSGLGLSIVKAICTAHGGTVIASSIPESGCRITVELPSAENKSI